MIHLISQHIFLDLKYPKSNGMKVFINSEIFMLYIQVCNAPVHRMSMYTKLPILFNTAVKQITMMILWIVLVDECRTLTGDSPDISTMLCQSMEALQDRPVLFRY